MNDTILVGCGGGMSETISSLEAQIVDVDDERSQLVAQKKQNESELSDIATEIRTNRCLPRDRWNRLLRNQNLLKRANSQLDAKLGELTTKRKKLHSLIDGVKRDNGFKAGAREEREKTIRQHLLALREKYASFSADGTRVASMRRMAAEFAIEIDSILSGGQS
ncbi:hypothetical protein M8A51_25655 [Schlegelella sp. S2-27]|uniref:Uncharacterized protein n=1 Tax=Caldimonas mangrovi TaxID=2944811 RepID=A0ABT0YYM0_9BURK|nr:hypothetical protein [Caldimonas mangrovi]MCM5682923.1 hypothetical protein [Caldimonas mangrovi]